MRGPSGRRRRARVDRRPRDRHSTRRGRPPVSAVLHDEESGRHGARPCDLTRHRPPARRRHRPRAPRGRRDRRVGDAASRVGRPVGEEGEAFVSRDLRILVVDDEEVIRDVLATLLEKEGYEVAVASTAGEALTLFEAEPYDVVLLDLMLPDRSGLDLLRDVRRQDPDAVVVIVTAYSSIEG
ncbi:MAG: hypothetical protein DMF55_10590, partial [Acidobacteria bacterium]